MRKLIEYLIQLNLVNITQYRSDSNNRYDGIKMGTSFKDFLEMDL